MYCISIFIQVSKSTLSRPEIAHKQVNPGRILSRRRFNAFFLGNSLDNLWKPSKKGDPENDKLLQDAVKAYQVAADRLMASNNPDYKKYGIDCDLRMGGPQQNPSQLLLGGRVDMIMASAFDWSPYF